MTSPDSAPSVELVVTKWLSILGNTGTRRLAKDPLPQFIVRRVAGSDTPEEAQDVAVVSVHTFANSPIAAITESGKAHKRMLQLILDPLAEIDLGDMKVGIDHARVLMAPAEVDYGTPGIVRYVGRYEIGLPYIT